LKPSLPFAWDNPPEAAQSFVLLADDVTPGANAWIHWIVVDIPPLVRGFTEGFIWFYFFLVVSRFFKCCFDNCMQSGTSRSSPDLPVTELANSWGVHGYGGLCPPKQETHAYRFRLFARAEGKTMIADDDKFVFLNIQR
jgi:phosphatidylethanolamine-binding protein (PEBP) family uncharacterized protein